MNQPPTVLPEEVLEAQAQHVVTWLTDLPKERQTPALGRLAFWTDSLPALVRALPPDLAQELILLLPADCLERLVDEVVSWQRTLLLVWILSHPQHPPSIRMLDEWVPDDRLSPAMNAVVISHPDWTAPLISAPVLRTGPATREAADRHLFDTCHQAVSQTDDPRWVTAGASLTPLLAEAHQSLSSHGTSVPAGVAVMLRVHGRVLAIFLATCGWVPRPDRQTLPVLALVHLYLGGLSRPGASPLVDEVNAFADAYLRCIVEEYRPAWSPRLLDLMTAPATNIILPGQPAGRRCPVSTRKSLPSRVS